jgi:uncharacterized protein (TIGR02145 family)
MLKNLDVTRYRNGDSIPQVTNNTEWRNLTTGAGCYYDNDPDIGAVYGRLYNWYAVNDSRGLAPEGWHIPTDDEWKELEMYLGLSQSQADATGFSRGTNEGVKLKEAGTTHWNTSNNGPNNESGFTALGAGFRWGDDGSFGYIMYNTGFWTSTESSNNIPWKRGLNNVYKTIERANWDGKKFGYSVRCIKD